ncbi:MAG: valine--tRNA ligase [Chitinivibrionales bacterium]
MDKNYDPKRVEEKQYKRWLSEKKFYADPDSTKEKFSIVIPPPNVTGILHMGHALNNSIQDLLIRYWKLRGREVLWMPGTDHAGIATQNVVERKLAKDNIDRHKLGREAFVKEVWSWKEEYQATITGQLKKLGSACDWDRERFTMDEGLSKAVRKVFVQLYNAGLIYKGKYIINWCPRCNTALSDEEAEHKEDQGSLWHFRYPFSEGGGHLTVATTRPETMLGDTAVAVNPSDERYGDIKHRSINLPLVDRDIPLIEDEFVDKEFGTGAVKVTPAHDPNDFDFGLRHNQEPIVVIDRDGRITGPVPERYKGLDRFEARRLVVEDMEKAGLLEKVEEHTHSVGHCYRCDTVVEPSFSDQWFVKMKPLAERALEAAYNDDISFYPGRWKKVYIQWMEGIRDWCISRQIWWGHRIPVWYCSACNEVLVKEEDPDKCTSCGSSAITQETDVLDTWFSSWLWPFSTMGWPDEDSTLMKKFYPTDVLVTAPEILFFWVARMIMSGLYFTDRLPFRDIVLHGTVRDKTGKKMSKSLGNGIDPLEIIEKYGAY